MVRVAICPAFFSVPDIPHWAPTDTLDAEWHRQLLGYVCHNSARKATAASGIFCGYVTSVATCMYADRIQRILTGREAGRHDDIRARSKAGGYGALAHFSAKSQHTHRMRAGSSERNVRHE